MFTSGVAGTQGGSRALQRSRSRWNNSCSCLIFDFFNVSIQTILLLVFLPVFRDEDAHKTLQSCVSGSGAGSLVYHLLYFAYKRFRERPNQLPLEAVSVFPGFEADELQTGHRCQRFGIQILKWLWRLLYVFLHLWFMVGLGIVYTSWVTRQAPHLNWLCTAFLVIACFPYTLVLTVGITIFI